MTVAGAHGVDAHVRPRGGLGDVIHRLSREDMTIAYLGASVTAQTKGYRPQLHELLSSTTGRAHRAVLAGTGAMGSISGVFLMDELVLPHRPDLCFVEYTTSDSTGTTPLSDLGAVLEGIVRKLRRIGCEACFLHLLRSDQELVDGHPAVETYERVADHYAVPSVHVAAWLRESGHPPDELLRDPVHTTGFGSRLVAEAVLRALTLIGDASPAARRDPPPLFAESFETTRVVAARREHVLAPETCAEATFRFFYPYVEVGTDNELRVTPEGELDGLVLVVGRETGYVEVEADGVSREYLTWDDACFYDRMQTLILDPFLPAGVSVRVRPTERAVDYSNCRRPLANADRIVKRLKVIGFMERP